MSDDRFPEFFNLTPNDLITAERVAEDYRCRTADWRELTQVLSHVGLNSTQIDAVMTRLQKMQG